MTETTEKDFFSSTKNEVEDYLHNRLLLAKMQGADLLSRLLAKLVIALVLGGLAFFILFFLSIMGGFYFGAILGSVYLGFAWVTGAYGLLFLVLYLLRKSIGRQLINGMLQIIFDPKDAL